MIRITQTGQKHSKNWVIATHWQSGYWEIMKQAKSICRGTQLPIPIINFLNVRTTWDGLASHICVLSVWREKKNIRNFSAIKLLKAFQWQYGSYKYTAIKINSCFILELVQPPNIMYDHLLTKLLFLHVSICIKMDKRWGKEGWLIVCFTSLCC